MSCWILEQFQVYLVVSNGHLVFPLLSQYIWLLSQGIYHLSKKAIFLQSMVMNSFLFTVEFDVKNQLWLRDIENEELDWPDWVTPVVLGGDMNNLISFSWRYLKTLQSKWNECPSERITTGHYIFLPVMILSRSWFELSSDLLSYTPFSVVEMGNLSIFSTASDGAIWLVIPCDVNITLHIKISPSKVVKRQTG